VTTANVCKKTSIDVVDDAIYGHFLESTLKDLAYIQICKSVLDLQRLRSLSFLVNKVVDVIIQ